MQHAPCIVPTYHISFNYQTLPHPNQKDKKNELRKKKKKRKKKKANDLTDEIILIHLSLTRG